MKCGKLAQKPENGPSIQSGQAPYLDSGGSDAANRFRCMCPEIMSRLASRPAESVIRMQLEVWKVLLARLQPRTHANRWRRRSRPSRTDLRHAPLFRAASSQWGPRMLPEALAPSRQDDAKSSQAMQPSRKGCRSLSSPTSDSVEPVPVGLDICISVSICHIYSLSLLYVFTISKKH